MQLEIHPSCNTTRSSSCKSDVLQYDAIALLQHETHPSFAILQIRRTRLAVRCPSPSSMQHLPCLWLPTPCNTTASPLLQNCKLSTPAFASSMHSPVDTRMARFAAHLDVTSSPLPTACSRTHPSPHARTSSSIKRDDVIVATSFAHALPPTSLAACLPTPDDDNERRRDNSLAHPTLDDGHVR